MGIIQFMVICAGLGLVAWLLVTYVPMPPAVRTIIIVAVCVILVALLLRALGLLGHDVMIPSLRD